MFELASFVNQHLATHHSTCTISFILPYRRLAQSWDSDMSANVVLGGCTTMFQGIGERYDSCWDTQRQVPNPERCPGVFVLIACLISWSCCLFIVEPVAIMVFVGTFKLDISFRLCGPWRPASVRTLQDKAERLMATTGHLFEEMVATCHSLGNAGKVGRHSSEL